MKKLLFFASALLMLSACSKQYYPQMYEKAGEDEMENVFIGNDDTLKLDSAAVEQVVDTVKQVVDTVKAEVEKRIAGNAPRGNGSAPAEITKETAKNMSIAELNKLSETNPELFNKIFN